MSSYNLTDNQKKIIIWIVQQIRNRTLPEEFLVVHVFGLDGLDIADYQGQPPLPKISQGVLEALDKAELILFKHLERQTGEYKCVVLGKAYEAVDANFGIKIDNNKISSLNVLVPE